MAPRHDLNGLRVQQYGDPNVYLMDQGLRRLIPTEQVMARLFTLPSVQSHRHGTMGGARAPTGWQLTSGRTTSGQG